MTKLEKMAREHVSPDMDLGPMGRSMVWAYIAGFKAAREMAEKLMWKYNVPDNGTADYQLYEDIKKLGEEEV